jgi:hypothetical protein
MKAHRVAYLSLTVSSLQKEIGAFNMLQFLEGLEAFSIATFTQVLGWSYEEVQVFLALVRKDAKNRRVHMIHDL